MCDVKGCNKDGSIMANQYTFVCKEHFEYIREQQIQWNLENPDKLIEVWNLSELSNRNVEK